MPTLRGLEAEASTGKKNCPRLQLLRARLLLPNRGASIVESSLEVNILTSPGELLSQQATQQAFRSSMSGLVLSGSWQPLAPFGVTFRHKPAASATRYSVARAAKARIALSVSICLWCE